MKIYTTPFVLLLFSIFAYGQDKVYIPNILREEMGWV